MAGKFFEFTRENIDIHQHPPIPLFSERQGGEKSATFLLSPLLTPRIAPSNYPRLFPREVAPPVENIRCNEVPLVTPPPPPLPPPSPWKESRYLIMRWSVAVTVAISSPVRDN